MLSGLRSKLFDMGNTLSLFKIAMRGPIELIDDASPKMTETDKFMIAAELDFIETRMDVLRKRLFELQK